MKTKRVYYFEVSVGAMDEKRHWLREPGEFDTAIAAHEAARTNGVYPFRVKNENVLVPEVTELVA